MYRNVLIAGLLLLCLFALEGSQGKTIIVDDDEGRWADYSTIYEALKNASSGDIIRVYNGTYYEGNRINQNISIVGNGTTYTVVGTDSQNNTILRITANNVNIEGCTFVGSSNNNVTGITADRNYTLIHNCSFTELEYGIIIGYDTKNCEIFNCIFFDNVNGIWTERHVSSVNVYSSLFYNNNYTAYHIQGMDTSSRVWDSSFIDNGREYQYSGYGPHTTKHRNETRKGNYWSDFNGTDLDNDGYGEGDYGYPSPEQIPKVNDTWYVPHYPRTFPLHTCSTSQRDLSISHVGNALIGLPLKSSEFTFYVEIVCRNDTAFSVPISIFEMDGMEWELIDPVISFNNSFIDGIIPQITSNSFTNDTQYLEINIEISRDSPIAVVINQFSKAVDQNDSFYWESDYDNNVLIIEFEIIDKASSDSAIAIPNAGYVLLAVTTVFLATYRRRSF